MASTASEDTSAQDVHNVNGAIISLRDVTDAAGGLFVNSDPKAFSPTGLSQLTVPANQRLSNNNVKFRLHENPTSPGTFAIESCVEANTYMFSQKGFTLWKASDEPPFTNEEFGFTIRSIQSQTSVRYELKDSGGRYLQPLNARYSFADTPKDGVDTFLWSLEAGGVGMSDARQVVARFANQTPNDMNIECEISVGTSSLSSEDMDGIVSEVRKNFNLSRDGFSSGGKTQIGSANANDWAQTTSLTWGAPTTTKIQKTVPGNSMLSIRQLVGIYGPFSIATNFFEATEEPCEMNVTI